MLAKALAIFTGLVVLGALISVVSVFTEPDPTGLNSFGLLVISPAIIFGIPLLIGFSLGFGIIFYKLSRHFSKRVSLKEEAYLSSSLHQPTYAEDSQLASSIKQPHAQEQINLVNREKTANIEPHIIFFAILALVAFVFPFFVPGLRPLVSTLLWLAIKAFTPLTAFTRLTIRPSLLTLIVFYIALIVIYLYFFYFKDRSRKK